MSTRVNPIRLFVTHVWMENDDYTRVFEYLEASGTFYYRNTAQPQAKQPIDKESQREDLRRQIAPCEVVVVLPGVYAASPELVLFQMNFAKAADRPIVAMENFGSIVPLPKAIADLADEVCAGRVNRDRRGEGVECLRVRDSDRKEGIGTCDCSC